MVLVDLQHERSAKRRMRRAAQRSVNLSNLFQNGTIAELVLGQRSMKFGGVSPKA
jgi:hypothetical protein